MQKGTITNQEKLLAKRRTTPKYNQVRIGDIVIIKAKNAVIHCLGTLD